MKTLLQILKLIPFPIVTAIIILIWKDVLFGAMIAAALWWLTIPAIILSIVFFFMGLRRRDNEYCTFEFEGGAIGPQSWGNEKNDYLNQHQPW